MCEVIIKKQSCGCEDYQELRVAFGDLHNCQLKCPYCFTLEQQPINDMLFALNERNLDNVKIIRFTGGEPLLRQKQIDGMVRELELIEKRYLNNLDLIVIQTNAMLDDKINIDELFKFSLPILFEVSFKGTNIKEYQYLTYQQPISQDGAEKIMKMQLEGYKVISEKCASLANISILARLGIFHSSITRPTFKFVYPGTEELMFNPVDWHPDFKDILSNQKRIWGKVFERRFVVEKIKTPADGSPGMGRRYRKIIEQLKRKELMLELQSTLPNYFCEKYFYMRGNDIYWRAARNL